MVHSLECIAVAWITEMETGAIVGREYALTCNTLLWGTDCAIDAYIIHREDEQLLKSTNSTVRFKPLRLADVDYYTCTVSINGFNFMSKPTFKPMRVQCKHQQLFLYGCMCTECLFMFYVVPSLAVDIRSSLENPIATDSTPTLTCTITLHADLLIQHDIEITVSWSGPVYGRGAFTVTEPLLNSSTEVPTYISSAILNAEGSFYDSGLYNCSAVVSPVILQDYIQNTSATSQSISDS